MTLKIDYCHWILNYFQDLKMITFGYLDLLYGKVKYGKKREHEVSLKVLKILAYELINSCLSEYMKICEYKGSRSFFE